MTDIAKFKGALPKGEWGEGVVDILRALNEKGVKYVPVVALLEIEKFTVTVATGESVPTLAFRKLELGGEDVFDVIRQAERSRRGQDELPGFEGAADEVGG